MKPLCLHTPGCRLATDPQAGNEPIKDEDDTTGI